MSENKPREFLTYPAVIDWLQWAEFHEKFGQPDMPQVALNLIKEYRLEIDSLKAKLAEAESIIAGKTFSYPNELNTANEKIQALDQANQRIAELEAEERKDADYIEDQRKRLVNQQSKIQALEAEIEILRSKASQHESTVLATVSERDTLKSKVQVLEAENHELSKRGLEWLDKCNEARGERDRLAKQNQIYETALEWIRDRCETQYAKVNTSVGVKAREALKAGES